MVISLKNINFTFMEFDVEIFEEEMHFDMMQGWWKKQKWPEVPINILPKLGLLVKNKEGDYLYGMFAYYTGTPIIWLEYIVGNPFIHPSKKRGALDFGITEICNLAKQVFPSVKVVFTSSNNQAFINSLIKSDFGIADMNMTQLVKNI